MKDQGQLSLARVSFNASRLLIFVLVFGSLGSYLIFKSSAASTANITVSNTNVGTIQTNLSTNLVTWAPLNSTAGAQTKFNALHPPYVRIHLGDDGLPTMPEIQQNQWANNIAGNTESRPFENLDELVSEVYAAGQQPLMNVKFAPDWMWACYPNSIGVNGTQGVGAVKDLTFNTFAQYMARLVDYYNKGTMTTEQGVTINNPSGTAHKITYWELWNEPDLNNETPCAPSNGFGLTYQQYTTMWNAVTAAMLAEDSSLKFVGPATAGAQFGSSQTTGNQYVDYLMTNSVTKPTALSFHGYGYWDNTVSDKWVFDGDNSDPANNCCGGITDFVNGVNGIHSSYPTLPIWLTEVNVNADWGNDTHKRPWSEFAAAWWGAMFAQGAPINVGIIHQYDALDDVQFGLININNGNTFISYHVFALLNQYFPPGSTIISSSSDTSGVLSLAVKTPSGHISVLVVNRQLASNTVVSSCGAGGVPVTVTVNLSGFTAQSATLQQIDKNNVNCTTNTGIAPTVQSVNVAQPMTVTFPGYGIAVFDVTPNTLPPDTTPPVISGVSTTNITTTGATVNWTTDEIADSQVEYGPTTSYGSTTTLNTSLVTSHTVNLAGLSLGTTYHYRVISKDASGNTATGSDNTFSTPSSANLPTVSITAPSNGAYLRGTVAVTANATDDVSVAGVQFQRDGVNLGTEDTASPYTRNWNTVNFTDGSHVLTAIVRDGDGNLVTSSSVTVTVDNTPPTVSVSSPSAGATVSGTANLSASPTDAIGVAGVQFQVDGVNQGTEDTTSPYSLSWNTTGVTNGTHTITAIARDAAGNTTTSAAVTVTVAGGGAIQGDLNSDGHVNITDLSILLSHYGQSATASQGDINSDGTVTILDLSTMLSHYGT